MYHCVLLVLPNVPGVHSSSSVLLTGSTRPPQSTRIGMCAPVRAAPLHRDAGHLMPQSRLPVMGEGGCYRGEMRYAPVPRLVGLSSQDHKTSHKRGPQPQTNSHTDGHQGPPSAVHGLAQILARGAGAGPAGWGSMSLAGRWGPGPALHAHHLLI